MNDVEELVAFHAKDIAQILDDAEERIQKGASDYEEERIKINSYEEIINVINDVY